MTSTNASTRTDPFRVLGVPREASEEEIRSRYLQLVKQFPPEREPERFREIRAAYETARDPLALADCLLEPPSETPPRWSEVIAAQEANPPPLTVELLLSLGNRSESSAGTTNTNTSDS